MRLAIAALLTLIAAPVIVAPVHAAPADPYQWCAVYPPGDNINCYFVTLEQCRSAISGQNSGFCRRNSSTPASGHGRQQTFAHIGADAPRNPSLFHSDARNTVLNMRIRSSYCKDRT